MADMTVHASVKGLRLSPRKVSLVASLVRGRSVADALVILASTPKRTAKPIAKVIESAKANAINNHGLKGDDLQITSLQVTAGPRIKRFKPAAMGRALPFMKRSSHIRVEVSGVVKPKKAAVKAEAKKEETK